MKIVCLIKSIPSSIYLVNSINDLYKIDLVVIENPKLNLMDESFWTKVWRNICSPSRFIGFVKRKTARILKIRKSRNNEKQAIQINNSLFGDKWKEINSSIPIFDARAINDKAVFDKLKGITPDLIIDHGTSIVKDHILETSRLALNIHTGLSPYYRGAFCTEWALINWDPYNIGVTIHKLTKEIDGGNILVQERVDIEPSDTSYSINMKLVIIGTKLMLNVIKKLNNDEDLQYTKQDYSMGYLTYGRQWSEILTAQINYIEKNKLIAIMLKKPSRKHTLKIIEE
jgi:folate-dependent phosphoribosylglycinamide formyltransferase PurN